MELKQNDYTTFKHNWDFGCLKSSGQACKIEVPFQNSAVVPVIFLLPAVWWLWDKR